MKFTHLDRIYYPKVGLTKGDILHYYRTVGPFLLPYTKDRPLSMVRCPRGVSEACWFQKECPDNPPDCVATHSYRAKSTGERVRYPLGQNIETILWLTNLGTIEYHIWLSKVGNPEHPTWMFFDLDRHVGAGWQDAVEVASIIKRLLELQGIKRILAKTTGKTGLHLLVPLERPTSYKAIRHFVKTVVLDLDRKYPEKIASESRIAKRRGKIYLDPAQNSKGRTMIAPYSLRTTPEATVSAPLSWRELEEGREPSEFTLKTMPARLAKLGDVWQSGK